jgi:uncharacterized membrane protein
MIVWSLAVLTATITVIGFFLVVPVLLWGLFHFFLKLRDGGARFGDAFAGFSRYGAALIGMIGLFLMLFLISLLVQLPQLIGDLTETPWLATAGSVLTLVFALVINPRLSFAPFLLVDHGTRPVESIREAWRMTAKVKWKLVGLVFVNMAIMAAGFLALVIGVILAVMIVSLIFVSAYRQLGGAPAAA